MNVDPFLRPGEPERIQIEVKTSAADATPHAILIRMANAQQLAEARAAVKQARPGVKRFSTQYAIDWGRSQGWKLTAREGYDHRLRRHFDLMLGMDAQFDTGDGIAMVQGAGLGERKKHYTRFEERGGVAKAQRMGISCYYVEFERGCKAPKLMEVWA